MENTNLPVFVSIAAAIGAYALGFLTSLIQKRIENRVTILKKSIYASSLGFTSETKEFGNIQVLYDGRQIKNLYLITAEISNDSNKGFTNLKIEFAATEGCIIYRQKGLHFVDNAAKTLLLESKYFDYFTDVSERARKAKELNEEFPSLLKEEVKTVTRNKVFEIPSFKRKTSAEFQFLVENAEGHDTPSLYISIPDITIGLKTLEEQTAITERKRKWTTAIACLLYVAFSYPIYGYSTSIGMSVLWMVLNLFASSFLSIAIYNFVLWLKRYFVD